MGFPNGKAKCKLWMWMEQQLLLIMYNHHIYCICAPWLSHHRTGSCVVKTQIHIKIIIKSVAFSVQQLTTPQSTHLQANAQSILAVIRDMAHTNDSALLRHLNRLPVNYDNYDNNHWIRKPALSEIGFWVSRSSRRYKSIKRCAASGYWYRLNVISLIELYDKVRLVRSGSAATICE